MPELPEVEVVRNQLKKQVLNKKIIKVESFHDNIVNGNINEFISILTGNKFIDVERYGKFLVFILDDWHVLISHLRMEGKYHIRNVNEERNKHEHIIFTFEDGTTLRYHDTRKFGKMDLRTKGNYLKVMPLIQLGPEPKDMKLGELYNKIKKQNKPVKVSLLDQTIIAGLGNIYVDETLFMSKIHPTRLSSSISLEEANNITLNARKVLDKALLLGGTTIRTFSATDVHGRFQNELLVHTKKGEPCPVCGNEIIKIVVGGRGTYVCESCQK
ncbi:DNA-formamidopyrimidine glycosylase [Haploplasma axanthum]|uniref:Formamidopyrimidine-DNA glycosylase n=1 Tax=Haploplasma axanthum TaxID=29552 RepID=A0A449BD87_HAPAX|nr:DNA-formamidopyrimidine glycosylase [Haploplasma axanthum]VEU80387.1 Foramidopyrimidine-DNA glycosylase [Haploplasma axanthum]